MKSLELEYKIGSLYLWTVKLPENCNSLETITIEFPPSLRLLMKHNAHILSNVKTLELFEDLDKKNINDTWIERLEQLENVIINGYIWVKDESELEYQK